jgi:putative spermidine/putrescine transport system substrate-binding protein
MSGRCEAIDRQGFAAVVASQKTGWGMAARMSRRRVLALGVGALLGAPAIVRPARAQGRTVYVNSYGGVWESSWRKAFFEPFTAQTGIQIKTVPGVSFAKLKAQVQTRNFEWDVVNLGDVEYGQAVLEGLLEKVDREAAKADQLPAHMVRDYGITSYSLGTNLVYRKDKVPNGGPQSWADFWDVKKFPGSRCLYDRSFSCLAFALLADGVPADKLYPMDVDRAFRKMSEIKPHIKAWWREGSQSQQLIRDGEVDMIAMWSARAIDLIDDNVPLELVWNGAEIYYANLLVQCRKAIPTRRRRGNSAISSRRPSPRRISRCCCPMGRPIPARAR